MSMWAGDKSMTAEERFWRRVRKSDSCWHWIGGRGGRGSTQYGVWRSPDGRHTSAHRTAFELVVSEIPAGLVLDHLCANTLCVNPAHLEAVTPQENRRRQAARIVECRHGHPYTEENTYRDRYGKRACRTCRNRRPRTKSC